MVSGNIDEIRLCEVEKKFFFGAFFFRLMLLGGSGLGYIPERSIIKNNLRHHMGGQFGSSTFPCS